MQIKKSFIRVLVFLTITVLLFALALNYIPILQNPIDDGDSNDEMLELIEGNEEEISDTQFQIETITEGTGDITTQVGDTLIVNYRGTFMDGTEFDSSYSRNEPFDFVLGQDGIIQGWNMGLNDMKVGEVRKLTIPYQLAYGTEGNMSIPGYSDLIFEIELLEIK